MHRNRGPLSHVQIDDGDESDWDTVTEVKEKNSASVPHAGAPEEQETPRDDTSYYQPSSIDIPVIADNTPQNNKEHANVTIPESVSERRQSESSVSSKGTFTHLSEKAAERSEWSLSESPSKRGNKLAGANLQIAGKYIVASGTSDKSKSPRSADVSPRSTALSAVLVDEVKGKSSLAIYGEPEVKKIMHQVSEHSVVISDNGVDETPVTVEAAVRDDKQQPQKQQRNWTSVLMPAVNKKAAKIQAAINQPVDNEFDGQNYFDLFKQSRYEYQFAQSPSGAEEKFTLPRENPKPKTMRVVDRIEIIAQRSFAEFFSIIRVVFAIAIALLVETSKTIIGGLIQPLIVASITVVGSYLLQPVLVAFFNYIIAPLLSFIHNVFSASFRSFQPFFNLLGQFFYNLAELVRSFRFVEVRLTYPALNNNNNNEPLHKDSTLTVGTLQPV